MERGYMRQETINDMRRFAKKKSRVIKERVESIIKMMEAETKGGKYKAKDFN
jgi:hypothetical protein